MKKENYQIANELDFLQSDKNCGRGIECVKEIVSYLEQNEWKKACGAAVNEWDKISAYCDISQFLIDNGLFVSVEQKGYVYDGCREEESERISLLDHRDGRLYESVSGKRLSGSSIKFVCNGKWFDGVVVGNDNLIVKYNNLVGERYVVYVDVERKKIMSGSCYDKA